MKIIGCDYHPSYQQIAMVDRDRRAVGRSLGARARRSPALLRGAGGTGGAGGDGNGGQRAVVRGDAGGAGPRVVDRRCGRIRRLVVRQQKTDRRDAQHILDLLLDGRFPRLLIL